MSAFRPLSSALLAAALLLGCGGREPDVVLYCAVDSVHSEPIVREFERRTGLVVDFHPDIEASKSVGHRRRLQEEASNPRCDVFWNNEVVQSVLLAEEGLLEPYVSPAAADIPASFKDPAGHWTGFAARGRVLIVNTERFPAPEQYPSRTDDLVDPAYAHRTGMARPLTGTTATHASAWLQAWGAERTFALFDAMAGNGVHFGPGNAHLMKLVRTGELDFGWTDTDDVRAAIVEGFPVAQVVPDQGEDEFGLVVVPNTVALVKGAPHPEAGRKLVDFLLGHDVEALLAAGPSAQIPVRADVARPEHVLDLSSAKVAAIDWPAVGRAYAEHVDALEAWFNR